MIHLIAILIIAVAIFAALNATSHNESFNIADLSISSNELGFHEVSLLDFGQAGIVGNPALPSKIVSFIIPKSCDASNLSVYIRGRDKPEVAGHLIRANSCNSWEKHRATKSPGSTPQPFASTTPAKRLTTDDWQLTTATQSPFATPSPKLFSENQKKMPFQRIKIGNSDTIYV